MADRDPYEYMTCCVCGTAFAMSQHLYEAAQHSPSIAFYCPYGHSQHFVKTRKERNEEAPKNTATLISIEGGKREEREDTQ